LLPSVDSAADICIVDLPADVAVKIDSLVDVTARAYRQGGDTRGLGYLRVGIATSFLLGESRDEPPPDHDHHDHPTEVEDEDGGRGRGREWW